MPEPSTYVVTGGTGFVGSNLAAALARREPDAELLIIDDFRSGSFANIVESFDRAGLGPFRGRVLAADITADRDYPPFHRSTRDGYAVRAGDRVKLPARLECVGEVRAGEHFENKVGPGQCVMIMTGAPLPSGARLTIPLRSGGRALGCPSAFDPAWLGRSAVHGPRGPEL